MSRSFELFAASAGDADAIAGIWHMSASLPGVGPAQMPGIDELRVRVRAEMAADWRVTVAAADGQVVGFLAIKEKNAVLDQLFVRPDQIGCGIGGALLGHAMTMMPRGFTLFTRTGNERARRFYEKAGLVHLRDDVHPRFGDTIAYYGWTPGR